MSEKDIPQVFRLKYFKKTKRKVDGDCVIFNL